MALIDKLTAIADAIRAKTGGTDTLTLDDMATEIAGIETGGGVDTSMQDIIISGTTIEYYRNDRVTNVIRWPSANTLVFLNQSSQIANNQYSYTSWLKNCISGTWGVGISCFSYCANLEQVILPNCTSIGMNSFQTGSNGKLKRLYVKRLGSPGGNFCHSQANLDTLVLSDTTGVCSVSGITFTGCTKLLNGEGFVYVPESLLAAYQADETWASLGVSFRTIEDYPEVIDYSDLLAEPISDPAEEISAEEALSIIAGGAV